MKERGRKRFCAFDGACGKESGAWKFSSGDEKQGMESTFFCGNWKESVTHCDCDCDCDP